MSHTPRNVKTEQNINASGTSVDKEKEPELPYITSPFNSAYNVNIKVEREPDFGTHARSWASINRLAKKK